MSHDSKQIDNAAPRVDLEGDRGDPADVERAWIEEAERRYQEFLAGKIEPIPASEALAQIRAELRSL